MHPYGGGGLGGGGGGGGGYMTPSPGARSSLSSSDSPSLLSLGGGSLNGSPAQSSMLHSSRVAHSDTTSLMHSSSASRYPGARSSSLGGGSSLSSSRAPLRKQRSIVVLGFSMVGKTALCVRCVNERFEEAYEPTYESSYVKVFSHHGEEIECLIKDTQGVGEQEIFRNEYGLGVHGYILVYSIASQRSFDIVQSINQKLINLMGTRHVPRVLVGNKLDLASPSSSSSAAPLRQVSTEAGQALADSWGCAFLECSAKGDENCERAFHALLDEIDSQNEPDHHARRTSDYLSFSSMGKCWRRICCCGGGGGGGGGGSGWRRGDDADAGMDSAGDRASSSERVATLTLITCWAVLLLSLAGLLASLLLGLHASDAQAELLSYLLFGFSLLLWLVSLVGVWALRSSSLDLLHVYAWSLGVMLLVQIGGTVMACTRVEWMQDHLGISIAAGVGVAAVQALAAGAAAKLSANMASNARSAPFGADFQPTYHSLYE